MWKCHIHFLRGILRHDDLLIEWAKEKISTLFKYSEKMSYPQLGTFYNDGFYEDGSFIQHYFFGYNGGYGKHFINSVSGLLYAFNETDLKILNDPEIEFLCEMIEKSYAPLIVNGRFMDIARGCESSRYNYQDYICGRYVMRSLCYLSEVVPDKWKIKIRSLLKLWFSFENNRSLICVDEDSYAEYSVFPSLGEVLARFDNNLGITILG